MSLDIWMHEHPIAYVLLGSYLVAFLIFAVEVALARHKRKITLQQLRLMRDAGEEQ